MSDFDDGLGPHSYDHEEHVEPERLGASGVLLNGCKIGERPRVVVEPVGQRRFNRFRERTICDYWSSCPVCGWHETNPLLAPLRRHAYDHVCMIGGGHDA